MNFSKPHLPLTRFVNNDGVPFFFLPDWPIFFLDNHVLVLYKPAGLLSQGDSSGKVSLLDLVRRWIKIAYRKPGDVYLGLVHRLDKPVAGIFTVARTSKAASRLSEQFRNKTIRKEYIAVVEGVPRPRCGTIKHWLIRVGGKTISTPRYTKAHAKEAVLEYEVLESIGKRSLIRVLPVTGRKHQIRAQLAAAGHPILGDMLYKSSHRLAKNAIALLARSITFIHPTLKSEITLSCPYPKGWPWPEVQGNLFWDWDEIKNSLSLAEADYG